MPYNQPIDPLEERIRKIEQHGFRVHRVSVIADSVDVNAAAGMAALARVHPWMRPGVVRSLSQMGFGPDHPITQFASKRSMAIQEQEMGGVGAYWGEQRKTLRHRNAVQQQLHGAQPESFITRAQQRVFPTVQQRLDSLTSDQKADILVASPKLSGIDKEEALQFIHDEPEEADRIIRESPQYEGPFGPLSPTVTGAEQKIGSVPVLGPVFKGAKTVGMPVIRTAAAVAQAPVQEAQSLVRNIYGATTGEIGLSETEKLQTGFESTDIGIAAEEFFKGNRVDLGAGFFPDPNSAVARIRRDREARAGQIGGHNVTAGRILANLVSEPDTEPFNLISGLTDASIAWYGDPVAVGLMGAGQAYRARRLFLPTGRNLPEHYRGEGLINGSRKYVERPTAASFPVRHPRTIKRLSETMDAYEIDKASNFTLGPRVSQRFASATNEDEVNKIIRGEVERGGLTTTTQLTGTIPVQLASRFNVSWQGHRFLSKMPTKFNDYDNLTRQVENTRRALISANAKEDTIRAVYNNMAKAKNRLALRNATHDAWERIDGILEHMGISDPGIRRMVTRLKQSDLELMVDELIQEIAADVPKVDQVLIGDKITKALSPHATLQISDRFEEIPDIRVVRRLASKWRFLTAKDSAQYLGHAAEIMKKLPGVQVGPRLQTGQLRLPFAMADHVMNDFLKPSWLLRVAWPVRVILEEQIRMANSPLDLDSAFSHPLSYVSLVLHKQRKLGPFEFGGDYSLDIMGKPIDELDSAKNAMFRGQGPWLREPTASRHVEHVKLDRDLDSTEYTYSLAIRLNELHTNEISRYVANHTPEESFNWLWRGGGRNWRSSLNGTIPGYLDTPEKVRNYVQVINNNILQFTGGNSDLVNAVRTGVLSGKGFREPLTIADGHVNPAMRKMLQNYVGIEQGLPRYIDGFRFSTYNVGRDAALDRLFGFLMAAPTNRLSRAPVFNQVLWKRAIELMPAATRSAQRTILKNAKATGIKSKQLGQIRAAINGPRGRLSADEILDISKGYALDETKKLLYDLTERRQWADIMRIVIPFGDAWQEIISRWSRLIYESKGRPLRRFQTLYSAAREPGAGEVLGAPEGMGWFHPNEYGEEVFSYPWSSNVNSFLTGVPFPLVGRVQGLNMVGTGIPGVGPVVQMPVAWLAEQYPSLDSIRDALAPFGAPGTGELPATDITSYGPAWFRQTYGWLAERMNLPKVGSSHRLANNTIMNTAAYLYSTGEYGKSRDEQVRLMEDAQKIALGKGPGHQFLGLLGVRALGMFMLPTSPTVDEMVKDKSGNTLSLGIVTRQFYAWADDIGYEEATKKFFDTFGENAVGAIVPKTVQAYYGAPKTAEQGRWWEDNPGLASRYPAVFGFFGPQDKQGEFDYNTYIQSLIGGQRQMLTPDQWRKLMDDRLGDYYYSNARAMVPNDPPTSEQRAWLREVATKIEADFPYWNTRSGLPERPSAEEMVEELYIVLEDGEDKLVNSEVGKALKFYLGARDMAEQAVVDYNAANGTDYVSFREAEAFAPTREWLRGVAEAIIKDYPAFGPLWEIALSREMSEDVAIREQFE